MNKQEVGLLGFICPMSGKPIKFEDCLDKCHSRCMSYPLLIALSATRPIVPNQYSTTEILNLDQQIWLKRNRGYYIHPEELIWRTFGTAFHKVLEAVGDNENFEVGKKPFRIEIIFGYYLTGLFDLFEKTRAILWDYKTIKTYAVKKLKAGDFSDSTYQMQLNIYNIYAKVEARQLMIEAIVKDWTQTIQDREGIHPVEDISIPILSNGKVEEFVQERFKTIIENQNNPSTIKPCQDKDLWFPKNPKSPDYGKPLRCMRYCDVSSVCEQYLQRRIK